MFYLRYVVLTASLEVYLEELKSSNLNLTVYDFLPGQ